MVAFAITGMVVLGLVGLVSLATGIGMLPECAQHKPGCADAQCAVLGAMILCIFIAGLEGTIGSWVTAH